MKEQRKVCLRTLLGTAAWTVAAVVCAAEGPDAAHRGFVVVADHLANDGKADVSDALQKLIDANPNRTLYFPDGTYLLAKPVLTPADPKRSVDLQLSNYAVLKAAPEWSSSEAMIRLGASHPANDIRTVGSNYSFTGGVVDGSGVADGISIDGGRETKVRNVSMKRVRVGLRIKFGANSGSSDCDIADVNIVGNRATNSVGVLVEGYDNTISNMRIADVFAGVVLKGGGNSLRNIHPLYTCDYSDYENSRGFDDRSGNNWFDFCYSDHFGVGFNIAAGGNGVYDKCFCMWYAPNKGRRHTAIRAEGAFNAVMHDFTIGFNKAEALNTVLETGKDGGQGVIDNLRMNAKLVNESAKQYEKYFKGKVF